MKNPIRIFVTSLALLFFHQCSTQGQQRVDWDGLKQRAATGDLFVGLDSLAQTLNSTAEGVYDLQTVRVTVNYPTLPWIAVTAYALAGQQSTEATQSELDDLVWSFLTQNVLTQDAADQAKNADGARKPDVLQVTLATGFPPPGTSLVGADDTVLKEMLGEGMHLYFRCDFDGAIEILTKIIGYRSKDPLVFYFRGLAFDKLGRTYEAEADWEVGADLEAAGIVPGRLNESLYRVQGNQRMRIEELRLNARVLAVASKRS